MNIKFCKKCLYSENHPLGLVINEEGICSGCLIHKEKDELDWDSRFKQLEQLVSIYRKPTTSKEYDCIIPVSGGGDSFFIDTVVNKLNLNPLLVSYNKYFNTPLGIKNLSNLKIQFNCDLISQNINPVSIKKLTRKTLTEYGNIYWPILAGNSVFPVQIAQKFKIPLIIWGAHQGIEQVGMFSYLHKVEMTRRYRKNHDLFGIEAENIIDVHDNLTKKDIWQFFYPSDKELHKNNIRGIYLNNYIRWDSKSQHEKMIEKYGFLCSEFSRTYETYDHVDCYNYLDIHDLLKLYKHGYSKVTDHASRDIRYGRITRDQGLNLVKQYEQQECVYLDLFREWLSIDKSGLDMILNQFRNPLYWKKNSFNNWEFHGLSTMQKSEGSKELADISYIANSKLKYNSKVDKYVTIGRGWP